jgi:DNA-binding CsgD family transcriptional regulator
LIYVRSIAVKHGKQQSEPTSRETEIAAVIARIAGIPGGDELLERIFTVLSERERDILWGSAFQTDATELGYELGIEKQSVQNHLVLIKEKLGFDSRPELFRRIFAALLGKLKKS